MTQFWLPIIASGLWGIVVILLVIITQLRDLIGTVS